MPRKNQRFFVYHVCPPGNSFLVTPIEYPQEGSCCNAKWANRTAYCLFTSLVYTGSTFRPQTVPLAVHCAACTFDSLSRIPDCEVISAVHVCRSVLWLNDASHTTKVSERTGTYLLGTTFSPVHQPREPQCTSASQTDRQTDNRIMPIADHTV